MKIDLDELANPDEPKLPAMSQNVPSHLQKTIGALLLEIDSKYSEGAGPEDCVREAYDAIASTLSHGGTVLTQELVSEMIPAWVLRWAVHYGWITHWKLLERETAKTQETASFLPYGDLQVGPNCKRDFQKCLHGRISYWRAQALRAQTAELPSGLGDQASNPASAKGSRAEKVDAFIERVLRERGRKISRKDIQRVAGYKDSTEFERWQRRDRKVTPKATNTFNSIIDKMTTEDFLARLKLVKPPAEE